MNETKATHPPPLGVVYGVGLFYRDAPHEVHVGSGWGLGLSHFPGHILLGTVLLTATTVILAVLSLRRKKA